MQPQLVQFPGDDRPIDTMVLHCGAFSERQCQLDAPSIVQLVNGWHLARGWDGIGYHYVIDAYGNIAPGRSLSKPGAHTVGMNRSSIGVLLVEILPVDRLDTFERYFTLNQRLAVQYLTGKHGIAHVFGHNDFAPKLCPGFSVSSLPSDFFMASHGDQPSLGLWRSIWDLVRKPFSAS